MLLDPVGFHWRKASLMEEQPKATKQESSSEDAFQEKHRRVYDDISQYEELDLVTHSTQSKRQKLEAIYALGGDAEAATKKSSKKGSVISPDDRRPPNATELEFYTVQSKILHNLNVYNMQHLAFFPQEQWLEAFREAVNGKPTSILLPSTPATGSAVDVKEEETQDLFQQYFDEFLLEPDNEIEPLLGLTFGPSVDNSLTPGQRKMSTLRIVNKGQVLNSGDNLGVVNVFELMKPNLDTSIATEIANLTAFQRTLARSKVREVLGFYKLMLKNVSYSKLNNAQVMENSSRFVVRTILNWGREYMENGGKFNRSKIGKHKRVSLFSDENFKQALRNFAVEKGDDISVDTASQFIKDYHRTMSTNSTTPLPGPPSSRATVHRWLKLLHIKLGPRGKKKSGGN